MKGKIKEIEIEDNTGISSIDITFYGEDVDKFWGDTEFYKDYKVQLYSCGEFEDIDIIATGYEYAYGEKSGEVAFIITPNLYKILESFKEFKSFTKLFSVTVSSFGNYNLEKKTSYMSFDKCDEVWSDLALKIADLIKGIVDDGTPLYNVMGLSKEIIEPNIIEY